TVTITAIQPRLRLSGTNRLGFQPSMAISVSNRSHLLSREELPLIIELDESQQIVIFCLPG
ncbi:MAG: hypothetical protein KZQ65_09120, partial [Candidatus Thiodiazotropha sp. (ex Gloverina cf. vestifex)]|nr:hypothetical protein [Candidatus Thiodiazotropha sp. (ex Gloverina cf. vestifex)]